MNIGETITKLRFEKGIYQKELASYLNLSVGTISNYEQGIHHPDLNTLCKIADYFGVTTDYLLGRTTHRYAPETLNLPLTDTYTVADMVNTTLELSPQNITTMITLLQFLKSREN